MKQSITIKTNQINFNKQEIMESSIETIYTNNQKENESNMSNSIKDTKHQQTKQPGNTKNRGEKNNDLSQHNNKLNPSTLGEFNSTNSSLHYQKNSFLENLVKGNLMSSKKEDSTRVIFQNINSLCATNTEKWKATIDRMYEFEADVVGLCETRINWSINKTNAIYTMIGSKVRNAIDKRILPGGTATITVNSMVNRITKEIHDKDFMGRWTGYCYNIGNNKSLYIINAYRVIDQQINITNQLSSNSQQHNILQQRGEFNKPRRQFIIDFCNQFAEICNNPANYIILKLDANENMDKPDKDGLLELM